jgi:hypothetical protein
MKPQDLQRIASKISHPKIDSLGSILQSIASQLQHPDAFFYDITVSPEGISGFFEGYETGIPFYLSLESFLSSAYYLGFIGAYDGRTRKCWINDNYEGQELPWVDYAQNTVEASDKEAQEIIRHAIECEWANHITRLAREVSSGAASSSVKDRIHRTVDTAFCDAVAELARIIEEANAEKERG